MREWCRVGGGRKGADGGNAYQSYTVAAVHIIGRGGWEGRMGGEDGRGGWVHLHVRGLHTVDAST